VSEPRIVSFADWMADGERRFGTDQMKWRFVCPCCGHVQAIEDFKPYKGMGATAEAARFNCIGRYTGAKRQAFVEVDGDGPCDYTSSGLFDVRPVWVNMPSGEKIGSFEFAPPTEVSNG
jgi:phage terminase large subunit GpA-like protein